MSDAINHPLPPEMSEPPIDTHVLLAQNDPPTTEPPTTSIPPGGN